ncbi:acetyl-CoA synthetase-like protein [Peniophora sp. CONT]|nr:acetyl-CoA synthetase-like protein [Peniophora sp. CONT]
MSTPEVLRLPSLPAPQPVAPAGTNLVCALPPASSAPAYTVPSLSLDVSHIQVRTRALQLAYALRRVVKLAPGEVVGVFSSNSVDYSSAVLGCFAARTPCTLVNVLFTPRELAAQLADAHAKVLIAGPEQLDVAREALVSLPGVELFTLSHASGALDQCIWDFCTPGKELCDEAVEDNETALLCYSSGTSGAPKGVRSTHANLRATLALTVAASPQSFTREEVWMSVLPMSHMYGFVRGWHILLAAYLNVHVIILTGRFDPLAFLDALETYKVTAAHIVPPIAVRLTKDSLPRTYDLSSLREWRSAAAPLGDKLSSLLEQRFGAPLHSLYGQSASLSIVEPLLRFVAIAMTETTAICLMSRQGEPAPPGSAGLLAPGVEGKIVDGELCVRGSNIMSGYLRRADADADAFDEEGFLRTGDLVRVEMHPRPCVEGSEEEAWIYVLDRKKEVVKWNGFQVAPAELEDILLRHPAVADCAVLGEKPMRTAAGGEAYAVANPEALLALADHELARLCDELRVFVDTRVAPFKRLRGGVRMVARIPKSPAGKVLRRVLREEVVKDLKAEHGVEA